jgi:uncharacterized protein
VAPSGATCALRLRCPGRDYTGKHAQTPVHLGTLRPDQNTPAPIPPTVVVRVSTSLLGVPSPLAPLLIEVLVCPEDRQPLLYVPDADVLYNDRLHRIYRIIEGIPNLLIDDATAASDAEHTQFLAAANAVRTGSPAA